MSMILTMILGSAPAWSAPPTVESTTQTTDDGTTRTTTTTTTRHTSTTGPRRIGGPLFLGGLGTVVGGAAVGGVLTDQLLSSSLGPTVTGVSVFGGSVMAIIGGTQWVVTGAQARRYERGEPLQRRGGKVLAAGLILAGVSVPTGMLVVYSGRNSRGFGPALIGTAIAATGGALGGTVALVGGTALATTSGQLRRQERGLQVWMGPTGVVGTF